MCTGLCVWKKYRKDTLKTEESGYPRRGRKGRERTGNWEQVKVTRRRSGKGAYFSEYISICTNVFQISVYIYLSQFILI